jgi:hypothetical protein
MERNYKPGGLVSGQTLFTGTPRAAALTLLMVVTMTVWAQPSTPMKLQQNNKTAPLVSLVEFDATAFPNITAKLPPTTVVLVNNTNRTIVALTARWSAPDPLTRRPHREIMTTDIYVSAGLKPIMVGNSRTLLAPGTILAEDGVGYLSVDNGAGGGTISAGSQRVHPAFASGNVEVSLDAVIFEDGELVGPDTRELAAELVGRKRAANLLLQRILAANGSQQALVDAAKVTIPKSKDEMRVNNHLRDYADQALRMLSLKDRLAASGRQVVVSMEAVNQWLASIPEPVQTFRR